jgi:uncharacterized protein YndB with AHSA1/START domain
MDDTEQTSDTYQTSSDLDASPDAVWEVLTDVTGIEAWLGEGSRLDPVDGGSIDTPDTETGIRRLGRVERAEPGRRLDYVWWPADDPATESTVSIEMIPIGGGTRLVVTERRLDPSAAHAGTVRASTAHASPWRWRVAAIEVQIARSFRLAVLTRC